MLHSVIIRLPLFNFVATSVWSGPPIFIPVRWGDLLAAETFVHSESPDSIRLLGHRLQTELARLDLAAVQTDAQAWKRTLKKFLYLLLARRRISGETIPLLHDIPRPGPENTQESPARCAVLFL